MLYNYYRRKGGFFGGSLEAVCGSPWIEEGYRFEGKEMEGRERLR